MGLKKYSLAVFFVTVSSLSLLTLIDSFPSLNLGLGLLLLYSTSTGIYLGFIWDKGLWRSVLASILVMMAILGLGFMGYEDIVEVMYGGGALLNILGFITALFSFFIVFSGIEYAYNNKNRLKRILTKNEVLYSFYGGWLHLVLAFCMFILMYTPEHVINSLISLRMFNGFVGGFLVGALPVYLYIRYKMKVPVVFTSVWVGWGVLSFIEELGVQITPFFPAPEYYLPPAPGYIFSSIVPISLILVYVAFSRNKLRVRNIFREIKSSLSSK